MYRSLRHQECLAAYADTVPTIENNSAKID